MKFKDLKLSSAILKHLEESEKIEFKNYQKDIVNYIKQGNNISVIDDCESLALTAVEASIADKVKSFKDCNKKMRTLILTKSRQDAIKILKDVKEITKYTDIESTILNGTTSREMIKNLQRKDYEIVVATHRKLLALIQTAQLGLKDVQIILVYNKDNSIVGGSELEENSKVQNKTKEFVRIMKSLKEQRQEIIISNQKSQELDEYIERSLKRFKKIENKNKGNSNANIKQVAYNIKETDKIKLALFLFKTYSVTSCIIYINDLNVAKKLSRELKVNQMMSEVLDAQTQNADKQRIIHNFNMQKTRVLITTVKDLGNQIKNSYKIINYDLKEDASLYIKRFNQLKTYSKDSSIIYFVTQNDKNTLKKIENFQNIKIAISNENPYKNDKEDLPNKKVNTFQDKNKRNAVDVKKDINIKTDRINPKKNSKYKTVNEWFLENNIKPQIGEDNKNKQNKKQINVNIKEKARKTDKSMKNNENKKDNKNTKQKSNEIYDFARYNSANRQKNNMNYNKKYK